VAHQDRKIKSRSAILADNWEENAQPGKSFAMPADDLSGRELKLVKKTWEDHLRNSLPEILSLVDWRRAK
jgi:hypothetical protein